MMRKSTMAAFVAALLLSGCGTEKPAKPPVPPADAAPTGTADTEQPKPSQPPPTKESGPMIPGDPSTAVKVYKRGQDAAKKLEDLSRKTAEGADDADAGE